jgi:K+-transporting ATPase ATPase C chain
MHNTATHLYRSLVITVVLLVVCGLGYNVAGWALSQAAFHRQANGSIAANGSTLIGQPWSQTSASGVLEIDPMWFQGRPDPDNPLELNGKPGLSGASNLGPKSSVLVSDVQALIAAWHKVGVDPTADLVTTSASGLDPDISPSDAMVQVPMVAKARHLSVATVTQLVKANTQGAQYGFLGAPYVNVLALNEALSHLVADPPARH